MTWGEELRTSVQGAVRLARFDAASMNDFNLTIDGFWRSFGAALLLAPISAIMLALSSPSPDGGIAQTVILHAVEYALSWIVFPVLMIPVSRFLGLGDGYVSFIIAYNWSSVVQVALFFVVTVFGAVGVLSAGLLVIANFAAFLFVLAYLTFVARTALGAPLVTATGIVMLDMVVGVLIFLGMGSLAA